MGGNILIVLVLCVTVFSFPASSQSDQPWGSPVGTLDSTTEITTGFFSSSSSSRSNRELKRVHRGRSVQEDAIVEQSAAAGEPDLIPQVDLIPLQLEVAPANPSSSRASQLAKGSHGLSPSKRLQSCINSHQPISNVTTWQMVTDEQPTNITVSHIIWSKRSASSPSSRNPLTITTQLSLNRIHQLEAQCRAWPGPISAVIYLAIIQHVDHASTLPNRQRAVLNRLMSTLESAKVEVSTEAAVFPGCGLAELDHPETSHVLSVLACLYAH